MKEIDKDAYDALVKKIDFKEEEIDYGIESLKICISHMMKKCRFILRMMDFNEKTLG